MDRKQVQKDYEEFKAAGRVWGQISVDRISAIKFPRTERFIIDLYLALPELTSTISDLLDRRGIQGAVAASRIPALLQGKRVVGNAVTLRSIPERKTSTQGFVDAEPINMSTREIYSLAEVGDVLVVDFAGDVDTSNFGGQSAFAAKTRGLAGSVVYGAVRDLPTLREINYPVWAAGVTPISGKHRMEAIEINGPVRLYNVVVHPGDLIVADESGICVIPPFLVDTILKEATEVVHKEAHVRTLIEDGADIETLLSLYRK